MNKEEYMNRLRRRLKKLPKEDYERAIDYFAEYFADAGPDKEAQAIEDLGAPEMAADQIIRNLAVENAAEPAGNVRRSFTALQTGILAVFAAPIALPLALAFGAVILAFVLTVIALILSLFLTAVLAAVSALPCILASIWLLFTSLEDGLATLGLGLIIFGVSILMVMLSILFGKWCLFSMTRLFGIIVKGGTYHEK